MKNNFQGPVKMLNKHKYEYSIMTCCRWEYNNISEWISYYKSIGFDHIYLYCNDDDPRDLYSNCLPFMSNENSFITFVHYAEVGNQFGMILDFLKRFKHETKWISFLDCDEFLLLRNINNIKNSWKIFSKTMLFTSIGLCLEQIPLKKDQKAVYFLTIFIEKTFYIL